MAGGQSAIVETLDFYSQALEHIDIPKAIKVCDRYAAAALALEEWDTKYKFYQVLNRSRSRSGPLMGFVGLSLFIGTCSCGLKPM